jgi:hypothetical protein
MKGKKLIGREDVSSCGGFPGFGMRIIRATFLYAGKNPLSKTALNSCVRYCIPIVGSSLKIFDGDEVTSCFFWGDFSC